MEKTVLIYYDVRMLGHNPAGWDSGHPEWSDAVKAMIAQQYPDASLETYAYPERPQRLTAIVERLLAEPIDGMCWRVPAPATRAQLQRAHSAVHVAYIESLVGESHWLAQDTTAVSPDSVIAARLAAGSGVDAVEAITAGESRHAFCIVRPPGHHAAADHARGFCLYNNIAVAAMHARAVLGYSRVMIWDWDMHHGNGTQDIFYDQPGVLVVDSHCAAPFYPGTGSLSETGTGPGLGYQLNVPLPRGERQRGPDQCVRAGGSSCGAGVSARAHPDFLRFRLPLSGLYLCHGRNRLCCIDGARLRAGSRVLRRSAGDDARRRLQRPGAIRQRTCRHPRADRPHHHIDQCITRR